MTYYLIIALQIICAYHVYKSKNNNYWYFVIILIPGIGCAVYVLTQIVNKSDVAVVQKELTSVINPTKKIKDLQQKVAFADTFQNKVNLADGWNELNNYEEAALAYQDALNGSHHNDFYANTQLLYCLFKQQKYNEVIAIAEGIKTHPDFSGSNSAFFYGLALFETGKATEAETILKKIDKRYSNYPERLELAKFYIAQSKDAEASEILSEMKAEFLNLTPPNRKKYKAVFTEVRQLRPD